MNPWRFSPVWSSSTSSTQKDSELPHPSPPEMAWQPRLWPSGTRGGCKARGEENPELQFEAFSIFKTWIFPKMKSQKSDPTPDHQNHRGPYSTVSVRVPNTHRKRHQRPVSRGHHETKGKTTRLASRGGSRAAHTWQILSTVRRAIVSVWLKDVRRFGLKSASLYAFFSAVALLPHEFLVPNKSRLSDVPTKPFSCGSNATASTASTASRKAEMWRGVSVVGWMFA